MSIGNIWLSIGKNQFWGPRTSYAGRPKIPSYPSFMCRLQTSCLLIAPESVCAYFPRVITNESKPLNLLFNIQPEHNFPILLLLRIFSPFIVSITPRLSEYLHHTSFAMLWWINQKVSVNIAYITVELNLLMFYRSVWNFRKTHNVIQLGTETYIRDFQETATQPTKGLVLYEMQKQRLYTHLTWLICTGLCLGKNPDVFDLFT